MTKQVQNGKKEVQEAVEATSLPEVWLDDLPKLVIHHTNGRSYRLEETFRRGEFALREVKE